MKYRTSEDITRTMLQFIRDNNNTRENISITIRRPTKTSIMYAGNINYNQLDKYLGQLEQQQLVFIDKDELYHLTPKGVKVLEQYNILKTMKGITP